MAYDFDNAMMSALLQHQQQALAYSPSLAAGTALKAVPEMAFDNPWATFLTALGTNLLGSGLTSYAGYRNQADTDQYAQQLGSIMSQGTADEQAAQLKASENLNYLSSFPQLIAAQEAKDQEKLLSNALTSQFLMKDATGNVQSIPGVDRTLINRKVAEAVAVENAKNAASGGNNLKQLQDQADKNPYLKDLYDLSVPLQNMEANLDSTNPKSDVACLDAAKAAFGNAKAFEGEASTWSKLPFVGKFLKNEKLSPQDRVDLKDLVQGKVAQQKKLADQWNQQIQLSAGPMASKIVFPQMPQMAFEPQKETKSVPSAMLDAANAQNAIPKGWEETTPDKVIPKNKHRVKDQLTGKHYLVKR